MKSVISEAPTATDNVDGQITGVPSINGQTITLPYTIDTQGTFEIVWTYTDSSGNVTTQTQYAIVSDTEAPDLNLQNLSLYLNENGEASVDPAPYKGRLNG